MQMQETFLWRIVACNVSLRVRLIDYGLRDYNVSGQIGLEKTPEEYVANLVSVFREVWRVLKDDGVLFLNIGDSYAGGGRGGNGDMITGRAKNASQISHFIPDGLKNKDLIGIPWMVAFALRNDGAASPAHMRDIERMISAVIESYETKDEWPDKIAAEVERLERELIDANKGGWYLRSDIIWAKPNPTPESVTDRPTKSHEYLFLLAKSAKYYYDAEAIKEPVTWSTVERLSQNVEDQKGSDRILGKTNGNMKAVISKEWDTSMAGGAIGIENRKHLPYPNRNKRDVWSIATQPFTGSHFATFPEKLVEPCILAGSRPGDIVFDPFMGSGTVERVAIKLGRVGMGTELNFKYIDGIASKRTSNIQINMQFPINQESNLTQQELIK